MKRKRKTKSYLVPVLMGVFGLILILFGIAKNLDIDFGEKPLLYPSKLEKIVAESSENNFIEEVKKAIENREYCKIEEYNFDGWHSMTAYNAIVDDFSIWELSAQTDLQEGQLSTLIEAIIQRPMTETSETCESYINTVNLLQKKYGAARSINHSSEEIYGNPILAWYDPERNISIAFAYFEAREESHYFPFVHVSIAKGNFQ